VLPAVAVAMVIPVAVAVVMHRARPVPAVGPGVVMVPVSATCAGPVLAAGRAATRSAGRIAVGDRNRTSGAPAESEEGQDSRDP
jgi:hypothetical protein